MRTLKNDLTVLQQKARERTVKTQNIEYDLETLVKKIKKGSIKLDPDYQRRHRWNKETSSRLIESLILNIPIPLIYLSQDIDVDSEVGEEEARYSVIDGQQRLSAILDFFGDKFSLTGLDALAELEGCKYTDLPPFLTRRLEERTVKCLRIDSTVDEQVKYDIFERLNSGAIKLEAQELRNATARGPFNNLIKELAKDNSFRKLLQINGKNAESDTKVKKMEDAELVLRFFSLMHREYSKLSKGFKQFLTDEMHSFNKLSKDELAILRDIFISTFDVIFKNFGAEAFAKYKYEDKKYVRMSKFNSAVFDALTIAVYVNYINDKKKIDKEARTRFKSLFSDNKFFESVSGSVNDKEKVSTRINMAIKVV